MNDREKKQIEVGLKKMRNKILSEFSFGLIRKWGDVYDRQGMEAQANSSEPVTLIQVKEYLAKWEAAKLSALVATPPVTPTATPPAAEPRQPELPVEMPAIQTKLTAENDYGLPLYEKLGCGLMHFQQKAVKQMLDNTLGFDVSICPEVSDLKAHWESLGRKIKARGQLLLSPTGTGKTFMVAAYTKYLWFLEYTRDMTIGPTEYLYVTRSSIVTQTARVFERQFGLGMREGVEVLNIEKLRSRAGEVWINPKTIIQNGEEKIIWEWRRGLFPPCLWLDECQSVKNPTSTQSEIIQAYSEINDTRTLSLFISATPFTRVSEMKPFIINCQISDDRI